MLTDAECCFKRLNYGVIYYIGARLEVQHGVPVRYYTLGGNTFTVHKLYGNLAYGRGLICTSDRHDTGQEENAPDIAAWG